MYISKQDLMQYLDDEQEQMETVEEILEEEDGLGAGVQQFNLDDEEVDEYGIEVDPNAPKKPVKAPVKASVAKTKVTAPKPKSSTKRDRNYDLMLNKLENFVKRNEVDIAITLGVLDDNNDEIIDLDTFKKWNVSIDGPLTGLEQKSLYNKMKKEFGTEPTISDITSKLDVGENAMGDGGSTPAKPKPKPKPTPAKKPVVKPTPAKKPEVKPTPAKKPDLKPTPSPTKKPSTKPTTTKVDRNYTLMLNKLENFVKRNEVDIAITLGVMNDSNDEVISLETFKRWNESIESPLTGLEQKSLYNKMKKEFGTDPTISDITTKLDLEGDSNPKPTPSKKPSKVEDDDPFKEIEDLINKGDDIKKVKDDDKRKKELELKKKKKEMELKKKKEVDAKKKKDLELKQKKDLELKQKKDADAKKKKELDLKKKKDLELKQKKEAQAKLQKNQKHAMGKLMDNGKKYGMEEEMRRQIEDSMKPKAPKKVPEVTPKPKNPKKPINFYPEDNLDSDNLDESEDDFDKYNISDEEIDRKDDDSPPPKNRVDEVEVRQMRNSLQNKDDMIRTLQDEIAQMHRTITSRPNQQLPVKEFKTQISQLEKENRDLNRQMQETQKKHSQDKRKMEEVIKDSYITPESGDFVLLQKKIEMLERNLYEREKSATNYEFTGSITEKYKHENKNLRQQMEDQNSYLGNVINKKNQEIAMFRDELDLMLNELDQLRQQNKEKEEMFMSKKGDLIDRY